MEAGCSINSKNNSGKTALDLLGDAADRTEIQALADELLTFKETSDEKSTCSKRVRFQLPSEVVSTQHPTRCTNDSVIQPATGPQTYEGIIGSTNDGVIPMVKRAETSEGSSIGYHIFLVVLILLYSMIYFDLTK